MAWMSDEEFVLRKDCQEKAITARSAKRTRTHCGKGGRVKLHSDYLTKKERDAMNGEVKSYRLSDPMTWKEFRNMPEDLRVCYIKALRKKYNVSDKALSQAMGVSQQTFCKEIRKLGIALGKTAGVKARNWEKSENAVAFYIWWNGGEPVKTDEAPIDVEEQGMDELVVVNDNPEIEKYIETDIQITNKCAEERKAQKVVAAQCTYAVPDVGEMTFEGDIDDILRSIRRLLEGQNVHLTIKWDVLDKEEKDIPGEINKEKMLKRLQELEKAAKYAVLNEQRRKAAGSNG